MPEKAIACPTCIGEQNDRAMRDLQVEFLRKVARAEFSYSLRVAKGGDRHVLMYSSYTRTFCGRDLPTKPHINYEPYDDVTLAKVCAGCRSAIRSLLEEVVPS
jgi:hypothetical protein